LHEDSQGFGVQYVSYYSALSQAIKDMKTFYLYGEHWNYGNQICDDSPFHCFFKKTNTCPDIYNDEEIQYEIQAVMLGRANMQILPEDWNLAKPPKRYKMHSEQLEPPDWVLQEHPNDAKRWWEAQMATVLFCLHDEIIEQAEEFKKSHNWNGPVMAMHIRRGDRTDLHKYSFDDYMKLAQQAKSAHGVSTIYLATDEPSILEEITNWQNEFTFIFQEPHGKTTYRWNKDTSKELTHAVLIDLYLMSECNLLIGAQRSMFGWIASRLILGKGNEISCPYWIAEDTTNPYGWWNGKKAAPGQCV